MRILFTPLAVGTHVLSMVPLAWACRSAGHDVRFAAQPAVIDTISRAGLLGVPVGASCDFQTEAIGFLKQFPQLMQGTSAQKQVVKTGGGSAGGSGGGGGFGQPWIKSAQAVAPDLVAFGSWWQPDLVVTDPMFYAGPLLAEVLGVPLVRLLWGPDWTRSGYGMGGFAEGQQERPQWSPELIELYESHGARTEVDFARFTIDPFPPSLQVPGLANRVTMRPTPYNGAGAVPDWLAEPPDRPRVCLTWSSTTTAYLGDRGFLVPDILRGLAELDVDVVLAIPAADVDRLGPLRPGVRLAPNLPLELLLPSCSAIVLQGGAGGLVSAAVHGVPQVIVPLMADQPVNAKLAAAAGIGIALDPGTMTGPDIARAVTAAVFDDGLRGAAQRLRREIRTLPTPGELVGSLEALVGSGELSGVA